MPGDLLLYLEDIRDAVASIRSYFGDRTFEEFVGDRMRLDNQFRRDFNSSSSISEYFLSMTSMTLS